MSFRPAFLRRLRTFALLIIFIFAVAPRAAFAGEASDVCTLRTSWTSRLNKVDDNTYVIDEFRPTLDGEAETEKFYKHKESGLTVSVGVRYDDGFIDGFGGKPTEIKLAVAAANKEISALNSPESAHGGVMKYRKGRLNIFVEKQMLVGDLTYSFVLECRAAKK